MARIETVGTSGIYSYGATMNNNTVYPMNSVLPDAMAYTFATGRYAVGKEKHYWTFSPKNELYYDVPGSAYYKVQTIELLNKQDTWNTLPVYKSDNNTYIKTPSVAGFCRHNAISNNKTVGDIGVGQASLYNSPTTPYLGWFHWGMNVQSKTDTFCENTRAMTNWDYNKIAVYPIIRGVYGSKFDTQNHTLTPSQTGTPDTQNLVYSVPWINRAVRYDIVSFYSGSKPVHSADFLGYTIEFEIYEQGNTLAPRDKFQIIDEHRIKEKFNVLNCYENSNHEFSITFNDEYCWTPKSTLLGPTPMEVGPYLDVMWSGPQVMEGIQIMKQVPCLVYKYDNAHYHIGGVPVIDPDIMDDPEHPLIIASDLRQMALSLGLPVITDLSALYEFSANNTSIDEVAEMYEDAVYFPKKKGARISSEEYVKGADDIRATQQYENTTNPMGTTPEYDRDTVDTNDYVDDVEVYHPPITPVGVFSRYYCLSKNDVDDLCDFLYDNDPSVIQRVLDGLKLNGENPMDFMIGLRMLPFNILDYISSEPEEIGFGNGVATGVTAEKIGSDSFVIELGECNFPTYYGNFLDYEPYTTAKLYIPYCNEVEIPTSIFAGHKIKVDLIVDITTGGCIGCISKVVGDKPLLVLYTTGMIGVEIPMIGTNGTEYVKGAIEAASQVANGAIQVASSAAMMGTTSFTSVEASGVASATQPVSSYSKTDSVAKSHKLNAGGIIGGVADIAKGIYDFNTMPTPLQIQGQGSPYTNLYKPQRCYFVIQRAVPMNIEGVMNTMGYACLERNPISAYPDGTFLMAQNPNVQPEHATSNETTELNDLLSSGVWK